MNKESDTKVLEVKYSIMKLVRNSVTIKNISTQLTKKKIS